MIFAAMAQGWPAAGQRAVGGFIVQDGAGGGSRVSAALAGDGPRDMDAAEAAMRAMGQVPLFLVREAALDQALAARGYAVADASVILTAPVARMAEGGVKPVTAFTLWPPLAIQRDIWAAGGIGPGRLAVMDRAPLPKCALLGRITDRAAGSGFVAVVGGIGFVHALYVLPEFRGLGLARQMMRRAAIWAGAQGATQVALAVTRANAPAMALYTGMGMVEAGAYHYRRAPA